MNLGKKFTAKVLGVDYKFASQKHFDTSIKLAAKEALSTKDWVALEAIAIRAQLPLSSGLVSLKTYHSTPEERAALKEFGDDAFHVSKDWLDKISTPKVVELPETENVNTPVEPPKLAGKKQEVLNKVKDKK